MNRSHKEYKKVYKIVVVFIIAFSVAIYVLNSVLPIFDELCEQKAKSLATIIANEQATKVMAQHSYDEMFGLEKDNNGNIVMIKSNIVSINEITSDIGIKIQEELNKQEKQKINIAIGSFTGLKLLAGRGPNIPIMVSPIGNVETDLKSEFIAQGINQTLHRIYLNVSCNVRILTPFDNIEKEIYNQVLLTENVIVGNIPDTYYNFNGIDDDNEITQVIQ